MQSHPLHRTRLANTRPHQLCWGDWEMGTAISCIEYSQVAGLIQKLVETPQKHRLFVQLFFVQLSFVYVLSVRKRVRARAHTEVLEVPEVLMAQCKANSACLKAVYA